ncbi:MAG: extracellular solute-binding protein, partial [Firmicutes bacterium]|nr:extracellular solute-binding protein [Bacillota bacterium]
AEKALIAQKPLVYSYSNDATRDRLIDGSAAIGVVWNGEYDYMTSNNEDIEFSVPKEGSEFFIDSWAVTADAANQDGAESWINYLCKAEVAAANFDYLYYTCPNKAAYELIDQEAFDNSAIFPDEETLSRCRSLRNLPQEAIDIYADAWKKVKAN